MPIMLCIGYSTCILCSVLSGELRVEDNKYPARCKMLCEVNLTCIEEKAFTKKNKNGVSKVSLRYVRCNTKKQAFLVSLNSSQRITRTGFKSPVETT